MDPFEHPNEASALFGSLLEKGSLQDILKTLEKVTHDVENLEQDGRTLIYEHYSKLIASASIMNQIHQKLNNTVEDTAQKLNNHITDILSDTLWNDTDSKKIFGSFQSAFKRKDTYNRLLQLMSAPRAMKQHLEKQEYLETLKIYVKYYQVLLENKTRHKTFEQLESIMSKLFQVCLAQMKEKNGVTADIINLLLSSSKLSDEEIVSLLSSWLRYQQQSTLTILEEAWNKEKHDAVIGTLNPVLFIHNFAGKIVTDVLQVVEKDAESIKTRIHASKIEEFKFQLKQFVLESINALIAWVLQLLTHIKADKHFISVQAALQLKSDLKPLANFSEIVLSFNEFLQNLMINILTDRFVQTIYTFTQSSLIQLLSFSRKTEIRISSQAPETVISNFDGSDLLLLVDNIGIAGLAFIASLESTIIESEKVVTSLCDKSPNPLRRVPVKFIEAAVISCFRIYESVADMLLDCYAVSNDSTDRIIMKHIVGYLRSTDLFRENPSSSSIPPLSDTGKNTECDDFLTIITLALLLYWLRTHAIAKLRNLFHDLELQDTATTRIVLVNLPDYCSTTAGRVLMQSVHRRALSLASNIVSDPLATDYNDTSPTVKAYAATYELIRATELLRTLLIGGNSCYNNDISSESLRKAVTKMDSAQHLRQCQMILSSSLPSIDIQRSLTRRYTSITSNTLSWTFPVFELFRVFLRSLLEVNRSFPTATSKYRSQTQLDIIWIRNVMIFCLTLSSSNLTKKNDHNPSSAADAAATAFIPRSEEFLIRSQFGSITKYITNKEKLLYLPCINSLVEDLICLLVASSMEEGPNLLLQKPQIEIGINNAVEEFFS